VAYSLVSYLDRVTIDHESGTPPYRQLAAILRERIESGDLTGKLPAEKRLADEYEVAHGTVRKALDVLRDEGLVRTEPGWGSSVVERG
jgi:GntR family transcriptional regulator